jgi:hypothetical protein
MPAIVAPVQSLVLVEETLYLFGGNSWTASQGQNPGELVKDKYRLFPPPQDLDA